MSRFWILIALSWIGAASALDYSVRIEQISNSGKTLSLNKGYIDEIVADDYGILLAKESVKLKEGGSRDVYKPVAKLKAAKVASNSSLWIVFEVFIPSKLKEKQNLVFFSESALLKGRREFVIDRKTLVDKKTRLGKTLKNAQAEDGSWLVKKNDYEEGKTLHDQQPMQDADITLLDLDAWEESTVAGEFRAKGYYKSPYAKDFARNLRVERFENMVAMFMKKHNDPKFTLENLYYEQRRDPVQGEFQDRTLKESYHGRVKETAALENQRKERMYQDLVSKGETWSDDYSDEELSELLYNVGAVGERERREFVGAQAFDYQFYASFGVNLLNNENLHDRENSEQSKYELEGAFEWYLLKNFQQLKRFTLEFSLRRSQDAFTTGDYNATGVEYSGATQLNWYPFRPPNAVEANIVFFGALFRYGYARYKIPSLGEEGDYQVLSFPGLRAGLKYNFLNGYGVRALAGFENVIGDRVIRNDEQGELPDRVSHLEGKISIGLSRFF